MDDAQQFIGDELRKLISNRLRELRQGESRRRLANRAGVSKDVINKIERAETTPSVETLARLCRALDITLAEFFTFKPLDNSAHQILDRIQVYLAPKPLNQIKLAERIIKQMDVLNEDDHNDE